MSCKIRKVNDIDNVSSFGLNRSRIASPTTHHHGKALIFSGPFVLIPLEKQRVHCDFELNTFKKHCLQSLRLAGNLDQ